MEFKGSRTEKNLWSAFAGESQARNKYTYYADKAREEGYGDIADVFEETAKQEEEHAKKMFQFLNGIKGTLSNLKAAAGGENYEATTMYKEFEKVAREEGFHEIADFFKEIARIEAQHEERYLKLVRKLIANGENTENI